MRPRKALFKYGGVNDQFSFFAGTPMADMCAAIQKKLEQRVGRAGFLQLYEQSRSALQAKRDHNRAKKKEQVYCREL